MTNQIIVQYATGGFILTKIVEGDRVSVEVLTSVGKLNKAIRAATEELSLLPKKAEEADE